jgi:hypothetical protein
VSENDCDNEGGGGREREKEREIYFQKPLSLYKNHFMKVI